MEMEMDLNVLANIALKAQLQLQQQDVELALADSSTNDSVTREKNIALQLAMAAYPDGSLVHMRETVTRAANAVIACGLEVAGSHAVVARTALEAWAALGSNYPKRISTDPLQPHELFRDKDYCRAAKHLLYNEFNLHYKHTIKSILLDTNYSYVHARAALLALPPSRLWTFLSFTARAPVSVPNRLATLPALVADRDVAARIAVTARCVHDATVAQALNREQYAPLISCPVCIEDFAIEDFVTCVPRGCLVCRACLAKVVNVGLYETGELRGKHVTCFLINHDDHQGSGVCGGTFRDEDVKNVVGADIYRIYEGLIRERVVTEAFGKKGVVSCRLCGYAEVQDPPKPKNLVNHASAKVLDLITLIETKITRLQTQQYTDHVLIVAILFSFELLLACFLISIVTGCIALIFMRVFLETTGLWRQSFNLLFELTGINANTILDHAIGVRLTNNNKFQQTLQKAYKNMKLVLKQQSLNLHPSSKPPRPIPFNCKNPACLQASCASCGKEWTACHVCHEKEKDSLRLYVEQAMSEAFIRTCPKCMTRYTKQSGCNKMTCPMCKFVMCYVCRRDIQKEGYNHFCQHFRIVPGTPCKDCAKCDLYVTREDEEMLERVAKNAEKEWREMESTATMNTNSNANVNAASALAVESRNGEAGTGGSQSHASPQQHQQHQQHHQQHQQHLHQQLHQQQQQPQYMYPFSPVPALPVFGYAGGAVPLNVGFFQTPPNPGNAGLNTNANAGANSVKRAQQQQQQQQYAAASTKNYPPPFYQQAQQPQTLQQTQQQPVQSREYTSLHPASTTLPNLAVPPLFSTSLSADYAASAIPASSLSSAGTNLLTPEMTWSRVDLPAFVWFELYIRAGAVLSAAAVAREFSDGSPAFFGWNGSVGVVAPDLMWDALRTSLN
ncbi:hypothetical protein HK100_003156, partial [Physocladia obscura]